ncbi:TPA: hypothetical protein N0F65_002271 [Lagenidium giganteum]|uniref:Uncharacterized protein n=1 Tax=Lagenidium giganteum TaxID=4803 RepID=A0AAV2YM04_9STRA|nr:TPA: hypothetical protein N0F65_002271 [Lagenidium giganteum]
MERTLDDELIDAFDVAVPERSAATTMKHSNNSVVQAMGAPRYPSLDSHESLQSPVVMGRPLLHSLSSSTYAPIYPSLNAEPMPTPVPAAVVGGPSDVVLPQVPAPALTASLPSDAPAIPTVPEELPRAIKRDNDKDAGNVSSNSTDSLEAMAQDPAALAIAQEKLMDELLAYGARTAYVADALAGETPHQVQERARRAAERTRGATSTHRYATPSTGISR